MSSFCAGCGNGMAEGERFCGVCGKDSALGAATPTVDPQVAFGLPPENSGKAIFSMICGLVLFLPPLAIAAVILGHLSLSDIRRSLGRLKGRGFAITGLVLGYLELAVCSVVLIIFAFSVSKVLKAGLPTNETSAVSAMRMLNTAEIAYARAHRSSGYTCSLSDLSKSWGLSPDLARGQTNGYVFTLQGCSSQRADGPIVKYQIVAYPIRIKAAACFLFN